jgi:hypothetical protein
LRSRPESARECILESLSKLNQYILRESYAGYDPYDALLSPLFSLPIFRSWRLPRFAGQQIVKRLPVNVRPLLGIRKHCNPVSYALCLQGYTYLASALPDRKDVYQKEAQFCLDEIKRLQTKGYSGACWGYDFDWQGRYTKIPAWTPTVVTTGFVTNALFEYYSTAHKEGAFTLCHSSAQFVSHDLHKLWKGNTFCYSYSPLDTQAVFNATMHGARLLVQVYSVTGESGLLEEAQKAVRFVVNHQHSDGSWTYSTGDPRKWIDNFHTAYVLDCLHDYRQLSHDDEVEASLDRGFQFYRENFFQSDGSPKYYHHSVYPIDATAAAQSIMTLARFRHIKLAEQVALWMIGNMQHGDGFFYYQRHRLYTNKIAYMRWSNAWMFAALSYLLSKTNDLV